MKFTQIPVTTFKNLQLNAGILVNDFNPTTGVYDSIIGATTGGVQFADDTTYEDYGSDVDNCPKNMLELKKLTEHNVAMNGTFVSVDADTAVLLAGAADKDGIKIIPRNDLLSTDFKTVWWIGDYSDENTGNTAGFIAIKLMNALNTGGFKIQSTDRGKGQFAFSFMGHYSMSAQNTVPYEIYVKEGSGSTAPSIDLNTHRIELVDGDTATLVATVVPKGTSVTWSTGSGSVATVSGGVVTAEGEGNTIITASITVDGETQTDTCTVVVTAAE